MKAYPSKGTSPTVPGLTASLYDFTDPKIRLMVERHDPTEMYANRMASVERERVAVVCDTDHEPWPCSAVRALREWEAHGRKPMPPVPNYEATSSRTAEQELRAHVSSLRATATSSRREASQHRDWAVQSDYTAERLDQRADEYEAMLVPPTPTARTATQR